MYQQKSYSLNRYQRVTELTSSGGDFGPKVTDRHMQQHVTNKPYPICRFQKNVLENFQKWPPGTYFKIDEVE